MMRARWNAVLATALLGLAGSASAQQSSVDLAVKKAATGAVVHEYSVRVAKPDLGAALDKVAIEIRGEKPEQVVDLAGWAATVHPSNGMYGCTWKVEWQRKPEFKARQSNPVAGFALRFGPGGPSDYCVSAIRFDNGKEYVGSGSDAIPREMHR